MKIALPWEKYPDTEKVYGRFLMECFVRKDQLDRWLCSVYYSRGDWYCRISVYSGLAVYHKKRVSKETAVALVEQKLIKAGYRLLEQRHIVML